LPNTSYVIDCAALFCVVETMRLAPSYTYVSLPIVRMLPAPSYV
jgi:hypothetical protein